MVRAQLHQLRKGRERDVIRDMLLNVFGQPPAASPPNRLDPPVC